MDNRMKQYQEIIKQLLQSHAEYRSQGDDGVKSQLVFDDVNGRYLLLDIGWHHKKYWHTNPIHIDLIDDKVWVQYDETEDGIATELLAAGVPKDHIVLGFKHPSIRPHTEFAVA